MTRELTINGRRIADDTDAWVIAEIGNNHGGSVRVAEEMILAARQAGADAVKFQKRDNRTLYTPAEYDAPYHSEHAYADTYGAHREYLEFGWSEYVRLKEYADSLGVVFFATAFDLLSVEFLGRLGVPAIKIGSGQATNQAVLTAAAQVGVPLIVSLGGTTAAEVVETAELLRREGAEYALLQCTSEYPCRPGDLNLRVIEALRGCFPDTVIGLSDHYDGICFGPPAYVLGARIFEKHFTLDHSAKGTDNAFSLEPDGLRRFVRDLKNTREALGDGQKVRLEAEIPALRKMARRDV